jgi:hypothetical protein
MPPLPQHAAKEIRAVIIEALRDSDRRFMDMNDSTSRNYLDLWDLKPKAIYEDTANYLEEFELFLLPKKAAKEVQKYPCIL